MLRISFPEYSSKEPLCSSGILLPSTRNDPSFHPPSQNIPTLDISTWSVISRPPIYETIQATKSEDHTSSRYLFAFIDSAQQGDQF
ncbi:hypothetical protein AVEN_172335-1 [Araneus ventricosus]|uniref:Uncharacterized protein n=1 Tax=Araneus ventricosus TaxID=182803 RepID=A0A4Y2E4M5_ARAVE|nr:hypothetical protein AVEN_172335-1 [Araneus ventricosus]